MTSIFTGIRVVEIAEGLGPAVAGMYLADNGADVVKIEPPSGEALRGDPAFYAYNRGKRSVVADRSTEAGLTTIRAWVEAADVVVTDLQGDDARGFDYACASAGRTDLVYVSMPAFGEAGPFAGWPGTEALASALMGLYGEQASYHGPPTQLTLPVSSHAAGLLASGAVALALMHRQRSGLGRRIVQSLIAGGMAEAPDTLVMVGDSNAAEEFGMDRFPLGNFPVFRVYKASDEYFGIACGNAGFWQRLCLLVEHPEWIGHPLMENAPWGIEAQGREWLMDRLEALFATRTRAEWLALLRSGDIPVAPCLSGDEFFASEHVREAGMRITVEDEALGSTDQVAPPIRFYRTPGNVSKGAPGLGSNSGDSVPPRLPRAFGGATPARHPLEGIKIVDLSGYIAGTYAPSLLADFGANVVKVESRDGDPFRALAYAFLTYNRNKRGIVLDLKTPEGREVVLRMVRDADVVVENYRPGTAKRLGLDYETLSEIRPRLVYLSAYGYGSTGPRAGDPGFDTLLQSETGIMKAQGGLCGEPVYLTSAVCDFTTAILGAVGVMMALYERDVSGKGQHLETSLMNSGLALQTGNLITYPGRPVVDVGGRDLRGRSPCCRAYRTVDGWLFVDARNADEYGRLLRVASIAPESAPAFDAAGRGPADASPAARIAVAFAAHRRADLVETLHTAGVPVVPVLRGPEVLAHEHFVANGLVDERYHVVHGNSRLALGTPQFDGMPHHIWRAAPILGEHTRDVLGELGYAPETIEHYLEAGIAYQGDVEEERRLLVGG